jgi:hypothetical protein
MAGRKEKKIHGTKWEEIKTAKQLQNEGKKRRQYVKKTSCPELN